MFEATFWILFACLLFTWTIGWAFMPPSPRRPLLFFCGFYTATYVIGGCILGWNEQILVDFLQGVWAPPPESVGPRYWIVLLAPLIVVPWVTLFVSKFFERRNADRLPSAEENSNYSLSCFAYVAAFVLLAYPVLKMLLKEGGFSLATLTAVVNAKGNTDVMYESRESIFQLGTTVIFGTLYVGLPALSFIALFEAFRAPHYRRFWRVAFGLSALLIVVLGLMTLQIMIPAVYLVSVGTALVLLGVVRLNWRVMALYGGLLFVFLQVLHIIKFGSLTSEEGVLHYFLRAPNSLSYYLWLFPGVVPHTGVRLLGDLTGRFQEDPSHAYTVGTALYSDPSENMHISPAIPAPAHVNAYADAGLAYMLFLLVATGFVVVLASVLFRRRFRNAIAFALCTQSFVTLYYLTQTSLRSAVVQSYGFIWALVALALISAMHPGLFIRGRRRRRYAVT